MTEKNLTASLEDYLEVIYQIIQEKHGVKAVNIANRLNVNRSSVTEALKKLAEKNYVNYSKYDILSLTEEGEQVAKEVIKKHTILYNFFTKILEIEADEASETACKIEHVISDNVLNKLISFMENYTKNME